MNPLILAVFFGLAAPAPAHDFELRDTGEFMPLGQHVEFYDRFGWRSYQADFEFDLEGLGLARSSRLSVRIVKKDGSRWDYSCKASRGLSASVSKLFDGRLSVVAECRIEPKRFAKAVDLHPEDIGTPALVFQAFVEDGKAVPGAQRGIILPRAAQSSATELTPYLASSDDANSLAVVFQSASLQ
ncbi:MAG: hypothetical protein PHU21_05675 [Elusimicrobia bacterium]|nr:hypothetical protein [Elusimicrobiota bacterium]